METMTINEIKKNRLGFDDTYSELSVGDTVYKSGENWGETDIASMDEWENGIPEDETAAKMTGFYDWYRDQEDYESWDEYRKYLLGQLIAVDVIDEIEEE